MWIPAWLSGLPGMGGQHAELLQISCVYTTVLGNAIPHPLAPMKLSM